MADGLHQVSFAHAHAAIEVKRVVSLRGRFGHGARGGMRELVRAAHDERIERVPQVELMIDAIEIQARLLGGSRRGRRGSRFRLVADEAELHVRHAHFHQDGLQQLAVGFRQALAEGPRRDANDHRAVIGALLLGRHKPGGKAMRVHPPFHVL